MVLVPETKYKSAPGGAVVTAPRALGEPRSGSDLQMCQRRGHRSPLCASGMGPREAESSSIEESVRHHRGRGLLSCGGLTRAGQKVLLC